MAMPLYMILAGLLAVAVWSDLRSRTIPDWVSLAVLLLYPLGWLEGTAAAAPLTGLAAAGLVFAGGLGLFALNQMGGGDVKLMTALALWCGLPLLLPFLLYTSLTGGVIAVAALGHWLIGRRLRHRHDPAGGSQTAAPVVVYGPAIAAGFLLAMAGRL